MTQRPPPPIVACGCPARRSSAPGAPLRRSLAPCIGERAWRLYQGKALGELSGAPQRAVPCALSLCAFPVLWPREASFLALCPACAPSRCRDRVALARSCAADPFPMHAALPRSEYSESVRLPTAHHERRALRTLVSPLPVQRVGGLGSRRISHVHEGSLVCVLWVCTPEEPA